MSRQNRRVDAVVDAPVVMLAIGIALVITATLMAAQRGDNHRRGWIAATLLALGLAAVGLLDLVTASPRDTHLATAVFGSTLPVFGALGIIRGTRPVRRPLRWLFVFLTAFVLLFAGLLFGATLGSRFLPF